MAAIRRRKWNRWSDYFTILRRRWSVGFIVIKKGQNFSFWLLTVNHLRFVAVADHDENGKVTSPSKRFIEQNSGCATLFRVFLPSFNWMLSWASQYLNRYTSWTDLYSCDIRGLKKFFCSFVCFCFCFFFCVVVVVVFFLFLYDFAVVIAKTIYCWCWRG